MTDEAKLHAGLAQAARAKAELEVLGDAFLKVEASLVEEWKRADTPDARERLHTAVASLRRVEGLLRGYVTNGKIAEAELSKLGAKSVDKRRKDGYYV